MKGVNGSISYQDVKMHKSEDVTYHCNGKEFTHLVSARVYKKKKKRIESTATQQLSKNGLLNYM